MQAVITRPGHYSATRTCTRPLRWTPGPLGAASAPGMPTASPRGRKLVASMGERVRLSRPLDFLVVADHSDGMGFFPQMMAGDPTILADPMGRKWYNMIREGKGADAAFDIISNFSKGTFPLAIAPLPGTPAYRKAWRDNIAAADEANEPHRFTAFIGYEWTSNTGGNNLHRNVIFRDDGSKARLVEPLIAPEAAG